MQCVEAQVKYDSVYTFICLLVVGLHIHNYKGPQSIAAASGNRLVALVAENAKESLMTSVEESSSTTVLSPTKRLIDHPSPNPWNAKFLHFLH